MEAEQVVALLERMTGAGVRAWVAGGWAVDVHPVVIAPDGSGVQAGLAGQSFPYAAEGFGGAGTIDGRRVPCLAVQQQLRFREGYAPRPVDLHDIALLEILAASQREGRPFDG